MRHFIQSHPEYKHDSAVTTHVNYDLVRAVEKITKGIDRDTGLGVEFVGHYGLDSSGYSTPKVGKGKVSGTASPNGVGI